MRIYQGVDLVEIPKLAGILERHRDFAAEIFSTGEREYCDSKKDRYAHFAGRFAAKEALMKALGTGFSGVGIDRLFQEIEVTNHVSGRPVLSVTGWAEKICRKKRIDQFTVSISHSADYAVATVILTAHRD
jgi:holo-[acyl-carrier protein] synthase